MHFNISVFLRHCWGSGSWFVQIRIIWTDPPITFIITQSNEYLIFLFKVCFTYEDFYVVIFLRIIRFREKLKKLVWIAISSQHYFLSYEVNYLYSSYFLLNIKTTVSLVLKNLVILALCSIFLWSSDYNKTLNYLANPYFFRYFANNSWIWCIPNYYPLMNVSFVLYSVFRS